VRVCPVYLYGSHVYASGAAVSLQSHAVAGAAAAAASQYFFLTQGKFECAEAEERFKAGMRDKYDVEGSPYHASARLWDDKVILPRDTRSVVALSLSAALNAAIPDNKFGVFRM
jgi:3-methylcrotonyl-CoA carboxylase beta subunit